MVFILMVKSYFSILYFGKKINDVIFINLNISLKEDFKDMQVEKVYDNIHKYETIICIEKELINKRGVYGFFCKKNNKLYIGSSENLVKRFKEHIKGRKSNLRLQYAISKYGLNNFYYLIFEFHKIEDKNLLINLETTIISYFKLNFLYNFKTISTSMVGYKHTDKAKQKMRDRFIKNKHPLLGKYHSSITKKRISLATKGKNNPMFGKRHNNVTKKLISLAISKPVYLYKFIEDKLKLEEIYPSSVYVAKLLNLDKSTIGRYIKNKKVII
jgi:group I intron endonuclease